MTVRYLSGGGISSNVEVGTITTIDSIEFDEDTSYFNNQQLCQNHPRLPQTRFLLLPE
jgi:hypothetical protein